MERHNRLRGLNAAVARTRDAISVVRREAADLRGLARARPLRPHESERLRSLQSGRENLYAQLRQLYREIDAGPRLPLRGPEGATG
jgi:hypothetical protein